MMDALRVIPPSAPMAPRLQQISQTSQLPLNSRQPTGSGANYCIPTRYPTQSLPEYVYQPFLRQHHPQKLRHPQPQYQHGWPSWSRYGSQQPDVEEDARNERIDVDAKKLESHFQSSEPYRKYRERQAKDEKEGGDHIWPDHLEKAFFRALVQYPPMGRRKQLHKDKQRGRNELIADCIEEITGEARTRKQVSSHIQVLRPFVRNDAYVMRYLSKEDICGRMGRWSSGSSPYSTGRTMSNYPVTAASRSFLQSGSLASQHHKSLPSIDAFKDDLDLFRPANFQMFVQRKQQDSDGSEQIKQLHTYTQSSSNPCGKDLGIDSLGRLGDELPILAAMSIQGRLDCNVVIAEASLAFPMENWRSKDENANGIEVGISFLCTSHHLQGAEDQIKCRNTFYRNGTPVEANEANGDSDHFLRPTSNATGSETWLNFGSRFWAKTLAGIDQRLREPVGFAVDLREETSIHLKGITVVQEIFTLTSRGYERILVMHWTFRLSTGSRGRTTWRKLILPPCPSYSAGPPTAEPETIYNYGTGIAGHSDPCIPRSLQSPFEYDSSSISTLSSAATWQTSLSDNGYISNHHQQQPSASLSNDADFDMVDQTANLAYDSNLSFEDLTSPAYDLNTSVTEVDPIGPLHNYPHSWDHTYAPNPYNNAHAPTTAIGSGSGSGSSTSGISFDPRVQQLTGSGDLYGYGGTHFGGPAFSSSSTSSTDHNPAAPQARDLAGGRSCVKDHYLSTKLGLMS